MASSSCSQCDKIFTMKKNMYAHMRNVHKLDPEIRSSLGRESRFLCNICGQPFGSKSGFSKHMRSKHAIKSYLKTSRIICPYDSCSERFKYYNILRDHLLSCHKIEISFEELIFNNLTDFEVWKRNMEKQTTSVYALDTAETLKDGRVKKFWRCHRSYVYKPKGNGLRSLKANGSNKIGKACPSRIELVHHRDEDSEVSVKFWKTHYGHSFDIDRMPLDKQSKDEIARQLQKGVSFSSILDKVREKYPVNSFNRICLIDRKDLHNIVQSYKINYEANTHQYDCSSVTLWVENMKTFGEDNPVLFYKAQDEESYVNLQKSDSVLIVMTTFQAQQLTKFGNNIIYIDSNIGNSAWNINLHTMGVVDNFGDGCPVAFCLSNRSDELIFTLFFNKIKTKVGIINTKLFLSDGCPSLYAAWKSVMSDVPHQLLCIWDVEKSWRNNLVKIKDIDERTKIYKALRTVQQSGSLNEFDKNMASLWNNLHAIEDAKTFIDYFNRYYAYRPESWAQCFRKQFGIDTVKFLESFHKTLKFIYVNGKKRKRIDKTVCEFLKFSRNSLLKRLMKLTNLSEKQKELDNFHRASGAITEDLVQILEPSKEWIVTSESDSEIQYHVVKTGNHCKGQCPKCRHCSICFHSYKCSCINNMIKFNICKHIHAVQRIFWIEDLNTKGGVEVNDFFDLRNESLSETKDGDKKFREKPEHITRILGKYIANENYEEIKSHFDSVINILYEKSQENLVGNQEMNKTQNIDRCVVK